MHAVIYKCFVNIFHSGTSNVLLDYTIINCDYMCRAIASIVCYAMTLLLTMYLNYLVGEAKYHED